MSETLAVLYDSQCTLCQNSKDWLQSIDKGGKLEFVPLQAAETRKRFSGLDESALKSSLHVVSSDGKIYTGASAYREIAKKIHPGIPWTIIFKLYNLLTQIPGMLALAEFAYRKIARSRNCFL